jgi:hypothetical protein
MMALVPNLFRHETVANTQEVRRIKTLPRRVWSEEEGQRLADLMTKELKTPSGTMKLRPVQAIALYEAMETGGLFGPIRVGGGKTLVGFLLAKVLEAKRPLLLLPAALIEKTEHDRRALAAHWRLPTNVETFSYEMLGRVNASDKLTYKRPDLIIADECHRLKNRRAGVTRRVVRYMRENPNTRFAGMSGTVMKGSVNDFAHILRWALKDQAPIPDTDEEVMTWAEALDEKINPLARRQPGALLSFANKTHGTLEEGRQAFQRRLLETKGVVSSPRSDGVTCSLRVSALEYQPAEITEQHFAHVKKTWSTPDGWDFKEAIELRRYLRELALGFHSIWEPRPPTEWLNARREWCAYVREILGHSRTLDTPLQVALAIDNGRLADGGVLRAWRGIEKTFTIQPKPVWHDDTALEVAAAWMEREKGIVWTEHTFFARKLAQMAKASYYGADGLDEDGTSITYVKGDRPIIASIQANGTGRNLQMFSSNLFTSFPPGPSTVEQAIGRTHRDGQEADEVTVDILLGCAEHALAFDRALEGARAAADTLGHDQKLLLADICFPSTNHKKGPLWA